MRSFLRSLFDAALRAADPAARLTAALPDPPARGRLIVVGAGKAAAVMAMAVARRYGPRAEGVVVTRRGHGLAPGENAGAIRVLEAAHPVPDDGARAAAEAMLARVEGLGEDDTVIALLSGGGSALLEKPVDGLTSDNLRGITRALLASGAPIHEMNIVRKHLSRIKGGRLASAAWPAAVHAFAVSDVPGDDPSTIASGPTVPDPSTCAQALDIIRRYRIPMPAGIEAALASGRLETPKPGDPRLSRSRFTLVAAPRDALATAVSAAREAGFAVIDMGPAVEGEAATVAAGHAALALNAAAQGGRVVILSGGELTVTHADAGSGGPNREYALALAIALQGHPRIWALAADTDGIDGTADAAGAVVTPDTLGRAGISGRTAAQALAVHDSGGLFHALGDAIVTGPTRTNVADFRAIVVA